MRLAAPGAVSVGSVPGARIPLAVFSMKTQVLQTLPLQKRVFGVGDYSKA